MVMFLWLAELAHDLEVMGSFPAALNLSQTCAVSAYSEKWWKKKYNL